MIPQEVGVKLENTMAKTKMIKGKTTIYSKYYHKKHNYAPINFKSLMVAAMT
jgi:hypothetical protein